MLPEQHLNHVHRLAGQLSPISELNEANLATLCKNAELLSVPNARTINAREQTRWILYLTRGSAQLKEVGERSGSLEGGTPEAARPLFDADSISGSCQLEAAAVLLKFDRQQYQTLFEKQVSDATEVTEVVLEEADQTLFHAVYEALSADRETWVFATEIANGVCQALEQKDSSLGELSKILQREPLLTAKLVKVANEGTGEVAPTVSAAVSRLGVSAARERAIELLMKAPSIELVPVIRHRLFAFYGTALRVSALSHLLAQQLQKVDAEKAQLAGLVHEIGHVPILLEANRNAKALGRFEELEGSLRKLSGTVGSWVLSRWHYDPELIELCSAYSHWYRTCGTRISVADVVTAAHLIEAQVMQKKGLPGIAEVPIGRRLKERGIAIDQLEALAQACQLNKLVPERLLRKQAA